MARGLFITFEGMDGSGKSTQIGRLVQRLRAAGRNVVETAEPGGTRIGDQIRAILLDSRNRELAPAAELLLYFAARAQNVEERIAPALERGDVVVSDRFTDSSLAYQGCGRGLGTPAIEALDRVACRGLKPDITLLLDIDLETSLGRAGDRNRRRNRTDRMEEQEEAFYRKVREAYAALAASEPERVRVIDGRRDRGAVERDIWEIVSRHV